MVVSNDALLILFPIKKLIVIVHCTWSSQRYIFVLKCMSRNFWKKNHKPTSFAVFWIHILHCFVLERIYFQNCSSPTWEPTVPSSSLVASSPLLLPPLKPSLYPDWGWNFQKVFLKSILLKCLKSSSCFLSSPPEHPTAKKRFYQWLTSAQCHYLCHVEPSFLQLCTSCNICEVWCKICGLV